MGHPITGINIGVLSFMVCLWAVCMPDDHTGESVVETHLGIGDIFIISILDLTMMPAQAREKTRYCISHIRMQQSVEENIHRVLQYLF